MNRQKALQRISDITQQVRDLQTELAKIHVSHSEAVQKADEPFAHEHQQLTAAQNYIEEQYYKQMAALNAQQVELNKKREKARLAARKPIDREIRKTTNEIDRLVNEAKDLADDYEVVVHFDDGTIYDPANGSSYHDSWESSSC